MKRDDKPVTWGDVLHAAEERAEIGATVERLKPMLTKVVDALEKGDAEALSRARTRLYKALKAAAYKVMRRWELDAESLQNVLYCDSE